ncbi:MAG: tetratricopeptide repeat protein [Phycisphaeraceae bacterium]|nr:tetratricopeptide repeat protein [Phycisphaeraceae bacterium]
MSERFTSSPPRRTGTWVVVCLVLLGVISAGTAFVYWKGVARRTWPQTQPKPDEGAGAVEWDRAAAENELSQIAPRLLAVESKQAEPGPLISDARRLVERYPRYAAGRVFLAQVLLFTGDAEGGYTQLTESLKINAQQAEVQDLAGSIARQLKRDDEALQHFSMAANLAPTVARHRVSMALIYLDRKQYDLAMSTLLEALRIDSAAHEAYAAMADLYARQNKLDQAINQYTKAIANTPIQQRKKMVVYIINKAMLQRRANRPEDSLQTLDALKPQERNDPAVIEGLATSWAQLARFDRAAQVYEEALALDPSLWRYEVEAARYRIKEGSFAKAEAHIQMLEAFKSQLPQIAELKAQLKAAREQTQGK